MNALLVKLNVIEDELLGTSAVTLNEPVMPFAVAVTNAIPLALVVAVAIFPVGDPDVNVKLAPLEGRVKVTSTPDTGAPAPSTTVTTRLDGYAAFTAADWNAFVGVRYFKGDVPDGVTNANVDAELVENIA